MRYDERTRVVNPAMIQLARESRGMSRAELAREIEIKNILGLEIGEMEIEQWLLERLCDALGYPESFFYQVFEIYPARICVGTTEGDYHGQWCCPKQRMGLRDTMEYIDSRKH